MSGLSIERLVALYVRQKEERGIELITLVILSVILVICVFG